jgi:tripartite-type tricarboxylate transporter receptor subunit TctC
MRLRSGLLVACALASALFAGSAPARAADFYAGKTVTFIVGSGIGGSYGIYAHTLAEYLPKHIPGTPTLVVQTMDAGGGFLAPAHMDNVALHDGTVIAEVVQNVPAFYLLGVAGTKFDASKWQWIGNMTPARESLVIWNNGKAKSLDDAKKTELVIGATNKSSQTYMNSALLNRYLGTKFKIIFGYTGMAPLDLAMEKGEIDGRSGPWSLITADHQDWLTQGKVIPLAQNGIDKEPGFENVPLMMDFATNDEQKAVYRFIATATLFGRSVFAPAGVPAERVEILRKAFDDTMKDADFLAAAKKAKMPLEPMPGASLQKFADAFMATPKDVIATTKSVLGLE